MSQTITTANQLRERHCTPQRGAGALIPADHAASLLALLPGWSMSSAGSAIRKEYAFADFYRCMAFVNAVAWIANREDHHPDLEVGYGKCVVRLNTHDAGGLSINDFICAAHIEALQAG